MTLDDDAELLLEAFAREYAIAVKRAVVAEADSRAKEREAFSLRESARALNDQLTEALLQLEQARRQLALCEEAGDTSPMRGMRVEDVDDAAPYKEP